MEWLGERRNRLANSWTLAVKKKSHSKDDILLAMRAEIYKRKHTDGLKSYILYGGNLTFFQVFIFNFQKVANLCPPDLDKNLSNMKEEQINVLSLCSSTSLFLLFSETHLPSSYLTSLKHIFTNSIRICYSVPYSSQLQWSLNETEQEQTLNTGKQKLWDIFKDKEK